ncbi:MAG: FAD-dependent oxidoreductase [Gammaproteobacteria bacterium]|nr:FAD-dependent oxidoreductase [Gammaproteobacteria bacterium]
MRTQARVVVIGGGVVGASALYHLCKRGWTDCVLVEMDELTSGSTWHAAGNIPTFSTSRNVIKMQHYSTQLYTELAADEAYPINYHVTGSIRLAQTKARFEEFQHITAMAQAMGMEYELLDLEETVKRNPFLETHNLVGTLWDPYDGDIDPSQLTQALASASRKMGGEINRFTRVTELKFRDTNEWDVITDKGTITAEYVINAAGYRGAEITQLGGKFLPMVSMEHQYLVTESIPELEQHDGLIPLVRDPDDSYYLRQEKTGLILGPYEMGATPHWADGKLPDNFAYQLYPDDLDRLEWYIEQAVERMPILGTVGVQRVINGPIPYSPDGLPYVGPAYGLKNFFHCCSFSFGICQGGGAGKTIAEWVIDGKPEWDLWSLDPRRYTDYADQKYVVARATELYQKEYAMSLPADEWPAARPALVTPMYERLKEKGALFGARAGWERATWFAKEGDDVEPAPSYHRTNWFERVGDECRHVREKVGLLDLGGFSKYEIEGTGAAHWLDSLIAGNLPKVGRLTLSYFCAPDGGLWSEMTITRLAEDHFLLITAAAAKWHDMQWLQDHQPPESEVRILDITADYQTLVLAGPRARDVLQKLTNSALDNASFPWLSYQDLQLKDLQVRALRVNYVGELGWELHVKTADALALYDSLMDAGEEFELRDFGLYAMESMRLEKCYRAWKAELDHEYSPLRSALDRFVNLDKSDFVGKQALVEESKRGAPDLFVPMVLDDAGVTDAVYGCPVLYDGQVVGYTTSGGYGYCIEKSIALGYVRTDLANPGTKVTINILGNERAATVSSEPLYDPNNEKPRA